MSVEKQGISMSQISRFILMLLSAVGCICIVRAEAAEGAQADKSIYAVNTSIPKHTAGQSVTLLPDGRWLLVGGTDPRENRTIEVEATSAGAGPTPLLLSLRNGRGDHTATVLPDGRVLIVGGIGSDGNVVPEIEIVDPVNAVDSVVSNSGIIPRSAHTATLLTNGQVLIAGGLDENGQPMNNAQLWNPATQTVSAASSLDMARYGHEAALLASGEGLIWGGQTTGSSNGGPAEIFDPRSNSFSGQVQMTDPRIGASFLELSRPTTITETSPGINAVDVAVDSQIAIRFNKPVPTDQINTSTITLVGPNGAVTGKVVGAEGGMLAFLTPTQELLPGAHYTVFVSGITDKSGSSIPLTGVQFTTHAFAAAQSSSVASLGLKVTSTPATQAKTTAKTVQKTPGAAQTRKKTTQADTAKKEVAPQPQEEREDWVPQEQNRRGDYHWRVLGLANDPPLISMVASDLAASAGQTAVSGHVAKINGRPLAGVKVSVGTVATTTDVQGRFLLAGVPVGSIQLKVDGTGTVSGAKHYTVHFIQANSVAGTTTKLPDTIYLSRVDPASEVAISSPADHEIVLTHPAIPGLEVHIPKGAVLRTYDGNIVTKLSITPIPIDRSPYWTPENFSVYFTLQPGGAFVDGDPNLAVKIIYPNYKGLAAGTAVDFWNYDPSGSGWKVYGKGKVSSDGKTISPDSAVGFRQIMTFGWAIGEVTGKVPPVVGPPVGQTQCKCGDPVDTSTGLFLHEVTDLSLQDVVPISIKRVYRQYTQADITAGVTAARSFGVGTRLSYDMYLYTSSSSAYPYPYVDLILADGGHVHYVYQSGSSPNIWLSNNAPSEYFGSTLNIDTILHQWFITLRNKTVLRFEAHSPNQLISITDRNNNMVTVSTTGDQISQVTSPNGRYIKFTYETTAAPAVNRITKATDNLGRSVTYQYDSTTGAGHLWKVTDPNGKIETYTYDTSDRLVTVTDKRGNLVVTNTYDATTGRVTKQQLADGTWNFSYTLDGSGNITKTTVTDPRGYIHQQSFNSSGYLMQDVLAQGQTEQQTYVINRDSNNRIITVTDQLGRVTRYGYNSYGLVTSLTKLYGTANAVSYSFGYDSTFNQLTTIYDPLSHLTTLGYDGNGNLTSVQDALGHKTTVSMGANGLPTAVTDPLSHGTTLSYIQADLSSVQDALGRTLNVFNDAVGRVQSILDPLGNSTQISYDVMDRVLTVVDPQNGTSTATYDENGNVLSFQDPRAAGTHRYTYDARNRVSTYQDPLGNTETYHYDGLNNLISKLDRKGQLTQYSYDGLNRVHVITYADNSTVTLNWDGGSRLNGTSAIVDSVNGTVGRTYDGLDRLTQETTTSGQVSYTYDNASRPATMTVTGQTQVVYTFDNANRLTNVVQGSNGVTIGYDNANRRTSVTLPNAVVGTYGYDNANQLLTISYDLGSTHIADAAYTYDAAGRRISASGTLIRPMLDAGLSGAVYNAANRLTSVNGATYGYDLNGNLTSISSPYASSYTWNVRNQLTGTGNGTVLAYDAVGRLAAKTEQGSKTSYVYDGVNAVLSGSSFILRGLGIDEAYAFTAGGSTYSFMTDALGSINLLSNSTGTTITANSYGAYGATSSSGTSGPASTDTVVKYAGGIFDATDGLYYNRARYFSPGAMRFISEDPIGLLGGTNFYTYALGDPVHNTDPTGKFVPLIVILPAIGGLAGGIADVISSDKCTPWYRAFGRGFISGAAGTLAGIGVVATTANPWLAGAAAGAVAQGLDQAISGETNLGAAIVGVAAGGVSGGVMAKVLPTVGRLPSLTITRTIRNTGPNSIRMMGQETGSDAVGAAAGIAVPASGNAECGCDQ